MSEISKIKWSSDEYTLENFVKLFPLPQVVRLRRKTNLKGNNERKGQPGKMLTSHVFVLHSVRNKEVIRATDALKNEFYLPQISTAKVEVVWKDYKKFYDNIGEMFNHFPAHVLVVEEDESLGIKNGDVLRLKRKIKIREKNYLKCVLLDSNGADVDIPFSYRGLFKTLGDLTSESIPLQEAVEFCRLPRNVKFIDDKLKIKRIDGTSKCPTLLSNLDYVTLHEVIDHVDVIASQSSDGQVVVSSIPLDDDVFVNAPSGESRRDPGYTRLCQAIDKKTTAEMAKEIGILHRRWVVFQEDGTKGPSSWNQHLFSLDSLGNQDTPHVKDYNHESIPEDKGAHCLPGKATVSKKQEPPPIPPGIPLKQPQKSKTLPRILCPSQSRPIHDTQENSPRIYLPIEQNKKNKPHASHQDATRVIKERIQTDNLEGEDGYVKMSGGVLQTKYDILPDSIHRRVQPEYSNIRASYLYQKSQGQHLQPNELRASERERSSSEMMQPEARLVIGGVHTKPKQRNYDPQDRQSQGSTFPRRKSGQSQLELTESRMLSDSTQESNYSDDTVYMKTRFEEPDQTSLYSDVQSLKLVNADKRNRLSMLKHPQKMPKAPPGLDFINSKTVRSWSSHEVLKFLKFIKLEKYTKIFKQKKIDGEMLIHMDKKGLHELQVTHTHAATIIKHVHECIKHENSTIPKPDAP